MIKVGPIPTKPKGARLVIITPPMYLPDDVLDYIKDAINADVIEKDDWPSLKPVDNDQISLVHITVIPILQ